MRDEVAEWDRALAEARINVYHLDWWLMEIVERIRMSEDALASSRALLRRLDEQERWSRSEHV